MRDGPRSLFHPPPALLVSPIRLLPLGEGKRYVVGHAATHSSFMGHDENVIVTKNPAVGTKMAAEQPSATVTVPVANPEEFTRTFNQHCTSANDECLVEYRIDSCSACRATDEILQTLELPGDIGTNKHILQYTLQSGADARASDITSVPTLRAYEGGNQRMTMVGAPSSTDALRGLFVVPATGHLVETPSPQRVHTSVEPPPTVGDDKPIAPPRIRMQGGAPPVVQVFSGADFTAALGQRCTEPGSRCMVQYDLPDCRQCTTTANQLARSLETAAFKRVEQRTTETGDNVCPQIPHLIRFTAQSVDELKQYVGSGTAPTLGLFVDGRSVEVVPVDTTGMYPPERVYSFLASGSSAPQ